jgi:hypothetical protein
MHRIDFGQPSDFHEDRVSPDLPARIEVTAMLTTVGTGRHDLRIWPIS